MPDEIVERAVSGDPTPIEMVRSGFLTVATAAEILGCSERTVYALMRDGELQYVRLGTFPQIPRLSVEMLLARSLRGGST